MPDLTLKQSHTFAHFVVRNSAHTALTRCTHSSVGR